MRSISTISEDLNNLDKVPRTTCCERYTTCCNSCIGFCYLFSICYFCKAYIVDTIRLEITK